MSEPPIIIEGSLVDAKNVAAHKCVRLSIDVPAELGAAVVNAFGWPTMVEPVRVAVARLVQDAQPQAPAPQPKEKRTITQLHGGSQAALTCKREAFWRFLRDHRNYDCYSEEQAAHFVRKFCQVSSRSEIETDPKARNRWHLLYSAFSAWLAEPVV